MELQIFDTFNLRSRISVNAFYALPFLADILCLSEKSFSVGEGLLLSAVLVVICQALLGVFRSPVHNKGQKNTAAEILASKSALSPGVRSRYYRKLASFEPEFKPILDYLQQDGGYTEAATSAVGTDIIPWLRAKTRDNQSFRLVYEENINYCYIRNMMRLKTFGIVFNGAALLWWSSQLIPNLCPFSLSENITSILLITMHIGIGAYLIFGVTEKTVDAAAKRYAYALLETIDIL